MSDKDIASPDLLIVGGDGDPNILKLIATAAEMEISHRACLYGISGTPLVRVDIATGCLVINGQKLRPKAIFARKDVFKFLKTNKKEDLQSAQDWFSIFFGWATTLEKVKYLNKRFFNKNKINKLSMLLLATKYDLPIAETYFTNNVDELRQVKDPENWICKPVDGGEYTQELTKFIELMKERQYYQKPITLQKKLTGQEIRVFRIGDELISFSVTSESLDYRAQQDAKIKLIETPSELVKPFMEMTDFLEMDFCAADFLADDKGVYHLLEINSGPMFMAFDRAAKGAVSKKIIETLVS